MRLKRLLTTVVIAGAMAIPGCSSTQPSAFATFLRNLTAAECDNQQSVIANLPIIGLTPTQAANLLAGACAGMFGTAPAPTPAAGNQPAIPGAPTTPAAATTAGAAK